MYFSKQNLIFIFLVFIFSCSPKQIDEPSPKAKVIRPIWLGGLPEDSLFIYGVSKLEKNSKLSLDSIASGKITGLIKKSFLQSRKNISDSLRVNFNAFDSIAWEKRAKELPDFFSQPERFSDDQNNYFMIKFNKNLFIKKYDNRKKFR